MTRGDKIKKRIERADKRGAKRREEKARIEQHAQFNCVSFSMARDYIRHGHYKDQLVDGRYMMVCEMGGLCQSPCNGDC